MHSNLPPPLVTNSVTNGVVNPVLAYHYRNYYRHTTNFHDPFQHRSNLKQGAFIYSPHLRYLAMKYTHTSDDPSKQFHLVKNFQLLYAFSNKDIETFIAKNKRLSISKSFLIESIYGTLFI